MIFEGFTFRHSKFEILYPHTISSAVGIKIGFFAAYKNVSV